MGSLLWKLFRLQSGENHMQFTTLSPSEPIRMRPQSWQDVKIIKNYVMAFIALRQPESMNCHSVSLGINALFQVHIDWHDTSTVLDQMSTAGEISSRGVIGDGVVGYTLK
jgi:hypothetical protein